MTKRVRIIHPVPSFVCPITARDTGKIVETGCWEVGEQVTLPDELADLLIEKGRAEEVKIIIENPFQKYEEEK